MNSIWSNATASAGASPFTSTGAAPSPGNGSTHRFQSLLQSSGPVAGTTRAGTAAQQSASAAANPAQPTAASPSTGTNSTGTGASITANDFLSLLVTEMQNQDPTADTDPNAYVNQLVQINSLEQLVSINQNLSTALGTTPAATNGGVRAGSGVVASGTTSGSGVGGIHGTAGSPSGGSGVVQTERRNSAAHSTGLNSGRSGAVESAPGNLSIPRPSASSLVVGHSLDGHTGASRGAHAIRDIPTSSISRL